CDHFTTEDTATSSAAATARVLSPAASFAIARLRRSIDNGPAIPAGLLPGQHQGISIRPLAESQSDSTKRDPALVFRIFVRAYRGRAGNSSRNPPPSAIR